MLPFNVQLKGFILGLLAAYFIIPYVQALFLRSRTTPAAA